MVLSPLKLVGANVNVPSPPVVFFTTMMVAGAPFVNVQMTASPTSILYVAVRAPTSNVLAIVESPSVQVMSVRANPKGAGSSSVTT